MTHIDPSTTNTVLVSVGDLPAAELTVAQTWLTKAGLYFTKQGRKEMAAVCYDAAVLLAEEEDYRRQTLDATARDLNGNEDGAEIGAIEPE